MFFFDVPSTRNVEVKVSNIPSGDDYSLSVFTANKLILGISSNPGTSDEMVALNSLAPGRYYAMVKREFPLPGFPPNSKEYRIEVKG